MWLQLISPGQQGAHGFAHQEFQLVTLHVTLQRPWQSEVTLGVPPAPRPGVLELGGSHNPREWVHAMQRKPGSELWDSLGHVLGNVIPANLLTPQDGRMTLRTAMFPDQAQPTPVQPLLRKPVAQAMQISNDFQ